MAVYYLGMKSFGRSRGRSGSSATSAAAYRSGERIRDERTGRVYDHSRRADVLHKEIVLPAPLEAQRHSLAWARNRTTLWNAAEHAESRRNSRVAREFVVALPHELEPAARTELAVQFARSIADRYRSAVDVAIHAPRGDARNYHAHLLATTREITPDGLGSKTTFELNGTRRHELGLPRWREEIRSLREHWADLTNGALERAHSEVRVSHLSRAERGLVASPPRVPAAAYHMERRGERSFLAEKIRERHQAGLERAKAEPDRHALEGAESERRELEHPSTERSLTAIGRSMLRDLGTGVRAAWRQLQGRFGVERTAARKVGPALESRPAPVRSSEDSVAAVERSREQSRRAATSAEPRAESVAPGAQVNDRAQSARNWLADREKHRVAAVDPATRSARNWAAYRQKHQAAGIDQAAQSARNWAAYREKQKALEAAGLKADVDGSRRNAKSRQKERSRGHGNDFSL